ncbi:DUF1236 domain-containing protein [Filomicrobium sp.]|uniref:DUF1236 domain-containing protein n=1 Tax=Filomicrobium sp. TaxID=2024831 RepID=UPI0025880EB6|nr:DUF1236 domain-containing protein [Filomicrobium sp.]MCV0368336.1 DUF1236 domain-containing protein [Filomicrobium sp.]
MKPVHIALSAVLMLGGMSAAYAQEGPAQNKERPAQEQRSQAQERGAERGNAPERAERGQSEFKGRRAADESSSRKDREDSKQAKQRQSKDEDSADNRRNDDRASKKSASDNDKSREKTRSSSKEDNDKSERKSADRSDEKADRDDSKRASKKNDDSERRAQKQDDDKADKGEKRADTKSDRGEKKAANVELQGEKKDRVRTAFRDRSDVKEHTDVDIDISIGRQMPRDWHYYPVPTAVVAIVPEYRGYEYVYVDDRYVIVEPDTYDVVAVIDSSGNRTYASGGGSGRCSQDITLSADDRAYLLRSVQMRNEVNVGGVSIGWDVPSSVELRTFPDPVLKRVSRLGSCRYFIVDDQIAIVDPNEHQVVVLIQD